jgi:hypothetical protein
MDAKLVYQTVGVAHPHCHNEVPPHPPLNLEFLSLLPISTTCVTPSLCRPLCRGTGGSTMVEPSRRAAPRHAPPHRDEPLPGALDLAQAVGSAAEDREARRKRKRVVPSGYLLGHGPMAATSFSFVRASALIAPRQWRIRRAK